MTSGVLASFEPVYAGMGQLGWSPTEVDSMDVWLVARFLGNDDHDPVIRGSRGLRAPSDSEGTGRHGRGQMGRMDPARVRPRFDDKGRMVDSGRVFRGEAAR